MMVVTRLFSSVSRLVWMLIFPMVSWAFTTSTPDGPTTATSTTPFCQYVEHINTAICDSMALTSLTLDDLPRNLISLTFTKDIDLENTTTSTTAMRVLHPENLTTFPALLHLSLPHCDISELHGATFSPLPSLISLNLASNFIHQIFNITFSGLDQLIMLDLSYNSLTTVRPDHYNLPHLRHLSLGYNKLTSLPDGSFSQLPRLEVLTLDGNDLSSVQSGNPFTGLHRLRGLNMRNCNQNFPQLIFDQIQNIEFLDLSLNQLDAVPTDAIRHLYLLQKLILSHNQISHLPDQAFQGLALHVLDLSNNTIESIDKMAFRNFRTEQLLLGYNELQEVPFKPLSLLSRNLFVLDLSGNDLSRGPFVLPPDLVYLETLNLSSTGLREVPLTIHPLFHLQELDLRHNHILRINKTIIKLLLRLQGAYLENNPWWCDCSITAMRDWLHRQRPLPAVCGTNTSRENANASCVLCHYPDSVHGLPIIDITQDQFDSCGFGLPHHSFVFVYVICVLIIIVIMAILIYIWFKRYDKLGYGRFCGDSSPDRTPQQEIPVSPIKVISNAGAGAGELPRASDRQGPVKNQAWESALVITNPHNSNLRTQETDCGVRFPGAETIV